MEVDSVRVCRTWVREHDERVVIEVARERLWKNGNNNNNNNNNASGRGEGGEQTEDANGVCT